MVNMVVDWNTYLHIVDHGGPSSSLEFQSGTFLRRLVKVGKTGKACITFRNFLSTFSEMQMDD